MQRQAYFLGAAYAAPRKIKFPTELQKILFFQLHLRKKSSLIKSCIFSYKKNCVFCGIVTPVFQFLKKELVFL